MDERDTTERKGRGSKPDKATKSDVNFAGRSASAKRTGNLIGCNYKKVQKIRKIIKDGTPEIQQAVRSDMMTINRAYNLIRDMQKGKKNSQDNPSAPQLKAAKILISRENLEFMDGLGGDASVHMNRASRVYRQWLQKEEEV